MSRRTWALVRIAGALAGPAVLARLGLLGLPAGLAAAAVALAAAGLAVLVLSRGGA